MSSLPFRSIDPFRADEEEEDASDDKGMRAAMMNKFLEARTVMLFGGVDQKLAERVSMQLLYLDHLSNEPIKLIDRPLGIGKLDSAPALAIAVVLAAANA